jgi:hypothetical protein
MPVRVVNRRGSQAGAIVEHVVVGPRPHHGAQLKRRQPPEFLLGYAEVGSGGCPDAEPVVAAGPGVAALASGGREQDAPLCFCSPKS